MSFVRSAARVTRYWLQRPWYAVIIVVTLSVGLGVNAGVLSFARAVLVGAIPFEDADRIVRIYESNHSQNVEDMSSSIPTFLDWQSMTTAFEAMGASSAPINVVLQSGDRHQRLRATLVTPSIFEVTGAHAVAGRLLDASDDLRPGGHPVVVVSEEFWSAYFDREPSAVGASLTLDGAPYTVVGVIAAGFPDISDPNGRTDVWAPMMMAPQLLGREVHNERVLRNTNVLAKLRPGATTEVAGEELEQTSRRLAEMHPDTQEGWTAHLVPIRRDLLGTLHGPAIALLSGAVLLLLIAVANAGFLLLLRTAEREGEFALRLALGASPGDLVRRLAEENALVVGASVVAALTIASQVLPAFAADLPAGVPRFVDVSLGAPAVLATVTVSVAILAVLCALPLIQSRRLSLTASLASGGRGGRAPTVTRLERGLILSQIATAAVLAFGAILLLRSLGALQAEDVGFQPDGLMTARIDARAESRPADELPTTARELALAAEQTPGVEAAYLWSPHVPGEAIWMSRFRVEDRPDLEDHELPGGRLHGMTPGAATGLGIRFLEGRDIETADLVSGHRVALVSETVARDLWPGVSAVGKRLRKWNWDEWVTVVGVVEDVRHAGRQGPGAEIARDFYFAMDQAPELGRDLVVLVRTAGRASAVTESLRRALQATVPDLPVYDVRSMESRLRDHETVPRLTAFLSASYAAVALVLAGLGLYTILSYAVERRRREIGLRMALGAPSSQIAGELTRQGLRTGLLGVVVGLAVAIAGARALQSLLYEVRPTDGPTILGAAVILLGLALAASGVPALRAARWSPAALLRGD